MIKFRVIIALSFCVTLSAAAFDKDSAEAKIGERLFLETRFAQFFAVNCGGNLNAVLAAGDPVMMTLTKAFGGSIAGPFAGQTMNCRQCHLVGDAADTPGGGFRTYADFARRSPIPFRIEDGLTLTPRNSPSLVNGLLNKPSKRTLHFDGEFPTITDLIKGTLTGRNLAGCRASRTRRSNISRRSSAKTMGRPIWEKLPGARTAWSSLPMMPCPMNSRFRTCISST